MVTMVGTHCQWARLTDIRPASLGEVESAFRLRSVRELALVIDLVIALPVFHPLLRFRDQTLLVQTHTIPVLSRCHRLFLHSFHPPSPLSIPGGQA